MGRRGIGQWVVTAALLLGAAATTSGCGASVDPAAAGAVGPPQRGGTLTVAVSAEPPMINFWLAPGAMAIAQQLTDGVTDPLVVLDTKGVWRPELATTVPTVANGGVTTDRAPGRGMTVAFQLQPAATWSDDVPITCADVRFTWKTVMTPRFQIATRLGWDQIDRVDCPTPKSVRIHFRKVYALYTSRILAMPPLPEHALKGKDFNTVWSDRFTVSSGPFLFDTWQRGVRLVLKRNPNYWRTRAGGDIAAAAHGGAYLDRVVFRFVKDANTLKMQLRMQEAQMAFIPPDTNLERELKATPDIQYSILPGAVMELLELRSDKFPLDDARVRQAIAYAIDRRMITDVILSKAVEPAVSPMISTQAPAYADTSFARYAKPNPGKVTQLLRSAGWKRSGSGPWTKHGKPLEVTWIAAAGSYPFRAAGAQLVQEQLRRQGIRIKISMVPAEIIYSTVAPHGDFNLGEWSEITGAEPMPALIYSCGEIPRAPSWAGKNRMAWCSHDADRIMRQADATLDERERARLVGIAESIIADQVPVVPLFQMPSVVAWSTSMHGLEPNPTSNNTWTMENWWVDR
jgi:peptide/nickel transport system substrate-binding protein